MKTSILATTSIFLSSLMHGQNFPKDYFEFSRPSWERQVTDAEKKSVNPKIDSMVFASTGRHTWEVNVQEEKQSVYKRIRYFKNILLLKGIDIDKIDKFILIEDSNLDGDFETATIKNGVVFLNDLNFSYYINLVDSTSLTLTNNFLKQYSTIDKKDPRSILYHLAKNNKIDQIGELAVQEMNIIKPDYELTKQFEVLIYNRKSTKQVRLCYLHELLVDVYK